MATRWMQQKLARQQSWRNRQNGVNPRFAVHDKVARTAIELPHGRAEPVASPSHITVQVCDAGKYTPPEGKGHRRREGSTGGNWQGPIRSVLVYNCDVQSVLIPARR